MTLDDLCECAMHAMQCTEGRVLIQSDLSVKGRVEALDDLAQGVHNEIGVAR